MGSNLANLASLPAPREVCDVTPENLAEKLTDQYSPAVLRGFASHWQIVEQSKKSLSDCANYLQSHATNKQVKLVNLPPSTQGRMFYSEDLRGMNFSVQQTSLKESLDTMLKSAADDRYCLQCISVKEHFSELEALLPNPVLPGNHPFIWIGNDITVAPHFDEANNIAVVAAGKRRFTLFPPEQVANLYVGPLDCTPAGQPISLVNLRDPDVNQHPRYKEAFAHALSVELEAGDAIYIPTPWWHHVESLSEFNVLVNYWWSNNYASSQLPFPMLIHAIQAFKVMPSEQQKAWQAMLQHYVFDEQSTISGHIPAAARGILGDHSRQISSFIHQWLASQIK